MFNLTSLPDRRRSASLPFSSGLLNNKVDLSVFVTFSRFPRRSLDLPIFLGPPPT